MRQSSSIPLPKSKLSVVYNQNLGSCATLANRALQQEEVGGSVQRHPSTEHYDNASLNLEDAWHVSPAWMQDLSREDQATASGNSQIEQLNQHINVPSPEF
ncbi:hypothetical protein GU249_07220 [Acinetobacter baumannii]|nr:hypothetical protein [Acinetobacter baumannii]